MLPLHAYKTLYPALREQRRVEMYLRELLAGTLESTYIRPQQNRPWNPVTFARKNFFSILFLAIYRAVGIPGERRLWYGTINHCLRGIVTGADNLLDDEYKEMLALNFPDPAVRFKSIMHILVFDRFLNRLVNRVSDLTDNTTPAELHDALFRALVPIGAEEAREEGGIGEIITPSEILSSVHMYKGGKLLCLSFVAPLLLEQALEPKLRKAEQGIYEIGIALQIIDDVTDLHEDLAARNHNYLVSSIFHLGTREEKTALARLRETGNGSGDAVERLFPDSVRRVIHESIEEALMGFGRLEEAGFQISRAEAYNLIKHLFKLRGLPHLLACFPKQIPVTMHHAC